MTVLEDRLAEYLRVRRQLGFKLTLDGDCSRTSSRSFRPRARSASPLTSRSAGRAGRARAPAGTWHSALDGPRVRAYLATIDPATEIPPVDLLHARQNRNAPYLYCEREIAELLAAAGALTPALRGATYRTVIGVMATSGLRIGETLALDRGDVDLHQGVLHIRDGKGRRHREVPVHDTTAQVLRGYARLRDRVCARPETPAFLVSTIGARITARRFHKTFRSLIAQVDPQPGHEHAHRRPHDLRHTFAVRTLLGWHDAGVDVDRAMPQLSTYLGHANPSCSYLVSGGVAGADGARRPPARRRAGGRSVMTLLAPTLQAWFTDRLMTQKNASPRTIAAYRDTLRLLLAFAQQQTGKEPFRLDFADLDAPLIGAFLNHLERIVATVPRPATRGSRRSIRSTATRRCVIPSTPPRSPA